MPARNAASSWMTMRQSTNAAVWLLLRETCD
jgi:hypothetical protein